MSILNTSSKATKALIILFFIAWMLPGLMGRDLWKADEPYSFGLVNHIIRTGDWVVPTLAGEPFMEKPPLFYLTAALFAKILSPLLIKHDAARIASGFYMMLTLLFVSLTARELFGKGTGKIAALILMGSIGIQITAHKLITDLAMLTGIAAALYGLAISTRRFGLGGFWIGTGIGIGFMSKGLLAPGLIVLTALILPAVFRSWRTKKYLLSLCIGLGVAIPWLVIWPYALYGRSPVLFKEWLWDQNIGRFVSSKEIGRQTSVFFYFYILPWFAFPALPLAIRTVWINRSVWNTRFQMQLPITAFLVMLIVLSVSASARDLYALPMLVPLSLLATTGLDNIADAVKTTMQRFNIILFGILMLLLWSCWILLSSGHPEFLLQKLNLGSVDELKSGSRFLSIALLYCAAWLVVITRFRNERLTPIITWMSGVICVWSLLMTIWLPALDSKAGYRALFSSLKQALPVNHNVIASRGIGESERAMLEYYADIKTLRVEAQGGIYKADLFLLEGTGYPPSQYPQSRWKLIWKGRKENSNEIYRLFKRIDRSMTVRVKKSG